MIPRLTTRVPALLCLSLLSMHQLPVRIVRASDAELKTKRIDIHVDKGRPIAGERSRFVVSPRGEIFFTYTLAAGEFSCKPLGHIHRDGTIELSAIDSESTWNVEGWATYGTPFDMAFDSGGNLHIATRHRGQPYGVDYWRKVDGVWRLESFGGGVTYGGNHVSLGMMPDGRPIVVCLDRNRTQLTVWERGGNGKWSATRPRELSDVASGQFDLAVQADGMLRIVFCSSRGEPICVTRSGSGEWTREAIAPAVVSRWIAMTLDKSNRLHVSYASGGATDQIQKLNYATLSPDGRWQNKVVASAGSDRHVGLTDIAVANGRVAIAWEHGTGSQFAPKDYGGNVGSVRLTVISNPSLETLGQPNSVDPSYEIATHGGRPGLALSSDGNTAWVGIYTGNDRGDDFYLLNCQLGDSNLTQAKLVDDESRFHRMFRDGCLKDIDSGNPKAQRRGVQRIDMRDLPAERRAVIIDRYLDHEDSQIRKSIVRELAGSPQAVAHFADRLPQILDDPSPLVRKTFLEGLANSKADSQHVRRVLDKAITSSDAMTSLAAAEILRQHPDWLERESLTKGLDLLSRKLNSADPSISGSAAMSLEQVVALPAVRDRLEQLGRDGSPRQRVRASLILFRADRSWDRLPDCLASINGLESFPVDAQLALCGLLGQVRTIDCVPLLQLCLNSEHASVAAAAVFALRSIAHVAELKPVAKHPKGFDLLALRATDPSSDEQRTRQCSAVEALVQSLRHDDPNVRQKACDALNHVRAKQATASIEALLNDPDTGVRIAAHHAISVLKESPSEALIDLEQWEGAAENRPNRVLPHVYRPPTRMVDGVALVGSDKQLLVDDFLIERKSGLVRRLHPFRKHPRNPVFQAQLPWEEGWADPFMSTVLYDPEQRCFKMWYRCGPRHSLKGYAVSADGVHWHRPDIAQRQGAWQAFRQHNLLGFDGHIATWKKPGNNVLYFPNASAEERFLSLFYQPPTKDYAVSRSADGIAWRQPEHLRPAYGDVVSLIWDPGRNQFLFFPKYNRQHEGFVRRSFTAATLDQLNSPFSARFPFLAGHREDARVADDACRAYGSLLPETVRLSEFHSEIYSVTAIPYEGVVVALYDLWPVIGNREGPLDMPMKVSRDMKSWDDVDFPRRALSIGRFGEWDSGMVYGGNTMLVVDNQIRLYYLGANMGHCTRVLPTTKPYHSLGVGLATLRLDGFASLRPTQESGELTTKPLSIDGNRLQINARCGAGGWIRVELLDHSGKVLSGYSMNDCIPMEGDSTGQVVTWRKNVSLPESTKTQTIRVRFMLSSADLFAFQFVRDRQQ